MQPRSGMRKHPQYHLLERLPRSRKMTGSDPLICLPTWQISGAVLGKHVSRTHTDERPEARCGIRTKTLLANWPCDCARIGVAGAARLRKPLRTFHMKDSGASSASLLPPATLFEHNATPQIEDAVAVANLQILERGWRSKAACHPAFRCRRPWRFQAAFPVQICSASTFSRSIAS